MIGEHPMRRIALEFDARSGYWRLVIHSRASGPEDPRPAVEEMLGRLTRWSLQFVEDSDE